MIMIDEIFFNIILYLFILFFFLLLLLLYFFFYFNYLEKELSLELLTSS